MSSEAVKATEDAPAPTPESAAGSRSSGDAFRVLGRVLTFRISREQLLVLNGYDLALGLFCTWIVGMGRYWDNERVGLAQHLGVGSVVYVFVLAAFLWGLLRPVAGQQLRYLNLLTFISLTSPPAILYAIPVQWFFHDPAMKTANEINLAFLGLVSLWRVSLLWFYLKRAMQLKWWVTLCSTLLPLALIVTALAILNLEKVVFNIMMGDEKHVSPNDDSYMILIVITYLSFYAAIPLIIGYLAAMVTRLHARDVEKSHRIFSAAEKPGV